MAGRDTKDIESSSIALTNLPSESLFDPSPRSIAEYRIRKTRR